MNIKQVKKNSSIILFGLIWLLLAFYILEDLIGVNFEPVLLIVLMASLWVIWLNYERQEKQLNSNSFLIWGVLIVFYWLVTLIMLSVHDGLSDRSGNVMNVVHSALAFIVIGWAVYKSNPAIDYLWISVGVGSFSIVILSFFEYLAVDFNLVGRLGDFYGNPIGFGIFANTFLIILIGALPWAFVRSKKIFVLYVTMGFILFFAVLFSQTRTAWLGLPEALLAWGLYYYYLYKNYNPKFNGQKFIWFFVAVVFSLTMVFSSNSVVTKRIGEVVDGVYDYTSGKSFHSSSGYRLLMYEAGVTGNTSNIWLGIGENQFQEFMARETAKIALTRFNENFSGLDFSHIHNQFLMSLITKGILGLMSVLLFFVFLFIYFIRGMRAANIQDKPIWIAGFVFSLAEFLSFLPESPLQRSVYSTHFFLITTLFIVFTALLVNKNQSTSVE